MKKNARLSPAGTSLEKGPHSVEAASKTARASGLHYVTDADPGIQRISAGKGFRYLGSRGRVVRDPRTIKRIKSIVIPPAWKNVWICTDPRGHLQATGRDARGRKQSKYHPRWREVRDQNKYARIPRFAQCLKQIHRQTKQHLRLNGLPREKVLATIIQLLETIHIRVGNKEYVEQNGSYGLTTLRDQHVKIRGEKLRFQFRGKSKVKHALDLHDRRLARIVKQCQDLPGQELFQYLDDDGQRHVVSSTEVNDYIREISEEDFTAKDFRTWSGTLCAVEALQQCQPFQSEKEAKENVNKAIEVVAKRLGNTKAVCRKCYIHPAIISSYLDGKLVSASSKWKKSGSKIQLEKILLRALRQYQPKKG